MHYKTVTSTIALAFAFWATAPAMAGRCIQTKHRQRLDFQAGPRQ
mgnify:CR=1 FL=1